MAVLPHAPLVIGDVRITPVVAGSYWWDGGAMFGVVPKTLWSKQQPADEHNLVEAGFNCFVIETGAHRILIDTGGGVRHDERARDRMRMPDPPRLDAVLVEYGFEPESFDIVINTHLHWDHCSGNTTDDPGALHGAHVRATLPNARYMTQRGELGHAREQHPRDAVSYRAINYEPLIESGQMHLLDGDVQIVPGVEVRVAPGHNRDMMIILARSRGETWCNLSDLAPFAGHVTPTWVAAFDLYPLETIATKTDVLQRAADEGWHCSFGHDPRVAFARIASPDTKPEGKWRIL